MADSLKDSVLAVDGGGTRCRFALQGDGKRVVAEAGSANALTDFDKTRRCLLEGLRSLAQFGNTSADTLYDLPAFVGLAGVTGGAMVARLAAALPLRNARYEDDRLAALRGALGRKDGLVAHCGTGSFFASQIGGKTRFAGGWGAVLGDEASAQWVGRKALTQLLRQVDRFDGASPLAKDLLDQFRDAEGIVEFARTANPAAFGALAPKVTLHAADGDPSAKAILQAGADHIAETLTLMGWAPDLTLCLTGGMGPHYARFLPSDMRTSLAKPLGEPLDGAIALAQDMEMTNGHR